MIPVRIDLLNTASLPQVVALAHDLQVRLALLDLPGLSLQTDGKRLRLRLTGVSAAHLVMAQFHTTRTFADLDTIARDVAVRFFDQLA